MSDSKTPDQRDDTPIPEFPSVEVLCGLPHDRLAAICQEVIELSAIVLEPPLPPDAEPSSYLREMAHYAARATK